MSTFDKCDSINRLQHAVEACVCASVPNKVVYVLMYVYVWVVGLGKGKERNEESG